MPKIEINIYITKPGLNCRHKRRIYKHDWQQILKARDNYQKDKKSLRNLEVIWGKKIPRTEKGRKYTKRKGVFKLKLKEENKTKIRYLNIREENIKNK